jgi:sulfur-carrier protein adenylyltransferase/sulfurtransferase
MELNSADRARYSRHLALAEIGTAGQLALKHASVVIVGVGGLGCPAALYLAASGVGRIGLVDSDRVDVSNLQRQVLYDTQDIGRSKAVIAREKLLALNPGIQVDAHDVELRAANARELFAAYQIVVDGSDRLMTRNLVNDACVLFGKPLVSAAIHRFEGQATTYVPGRGPCYRCLFPNAADGITPNCAEAGVLGVLPGVLGTIQATEAIKLILNIGEPLIGRLLTYDALELRFREFRDCAVCGDRPTIVQLLDPPRMPAAPETLQRLSPLELRNRLAAANSAALILIDVREPAEFAAGHLAGAVNIPVAEIERRQTEIPARVLPIFICRSGARSLRAGAAALGAGRPEAAHLEGGLLAWAASIDPNFIVA